MNLKISGHHVDVTPALREYTIGKLGRVERHNDQVIDAAVIFCIDRHSEKDKRQRAEISLLLKDKKLVVKSADGNLYAAIDLAVDKLDRQVIRHKDRVRGYEHSAIKHSSDEASIDEAMPE
ncbi:MAG: ribosome hibernation-promoting factor, HPF/YfiA family [Janthinobacterium lividum]